LCLKSMALNMGFFRKAVLLEAGAVILFFGALATHPELEQSGAQALSELQALGYRTPTVSEPVRVYPAKTGGAFTAGHAGGWHPGVISLRENPAGSSGPEIYLRHELMHEACHLTCGGRLPLWAEEAAAMDFSGELKAQSISGPPAESELDHLREKVRIGAGLDAVSYGALSKLVSVHGWPSWHCGVSSEIEKLVRDPAGSGFSYILISLLSGEILHAKGDLTTRYPPGSLLKIPYAASLIAAENTAVGEELCASDTMRLLGRRHAFSPETFHLLTSAVKDAPLAESLADPEAGGRDEHFWRQLVGERSPEGDYPFEANLREIARVLRASLLLKPERFYGLSGNGFTPGSTLYPEPEKHKAILKRLHALCKTGTASDARGNPLTGHLMVAWPREDPLYLAVFRSNGSNGASIIRRASEVLQAWSSRYTPLYGRVRVRLLSLTPRDSWEIQDVCPSLERPEPGGRSLRFSTCGRFKIVSSARGSRSERWVAGLLESHAGGDAVILQTDPETYADAVLAAEAQDLRGEAQKALRAVIFRNGIHGGHRHPDTRSLCDATHCMVFQGQAADGSGKPPGKTDLVLLKLLDEMAAQKKSDWLSFSEGGVTGWEKRISLRELKALVNEPAILDLRRERTRSGEIVVHLMYPETEEKVPCEDFRARLKLPSCPESIQSDDATGAWSFQGIGKGHGQGLSVDNARTLAGSGYSASAILRDAYK
jgi:hypothetical protein